MRLESYDLPNEWKWAKIGDFTKILRGVSYKKDDASKTPKKDYLPILRANNINTNLNHDDLVYVPSEKVKKDQIILKGDIIISMSSGSKNLVGKTAQAVNDFDGSFGAFCGLIRVTEEVDKKFIGFFFKSQNYRKIISHLSNGININNLRREYLESMPIPLPPIQTQQKIVEILEKAEKLKEWRDEADVLTDEYSKSVFLEMFGDPVKNPKNWEITKINSFVKTILSGWSVGGESRIKKDDEIGVLKISAVTTGEFLPDEYKVVNKDLIKKELVHPMKGDILFSRANTKELVAAVCIVDKDRKDLFLPDKLWKIVLDENKVNPFYFKNVLSNEAYRNELRKKATGTSGSMFNISKKKLLNTNFLIPPIELQNQFAETVKKAEQLKKYQKQSKQQIDNLFNTLMQKAFKGELTC